MNSYSYSKISTFRACPYRYKLQYVDKIKVFRENPIFEKGRFIHALLESFPAVVDYAFNFPETRLKRHEHIAFVDRLVRKDKKIQFLLSRNVCVYQEKHFYLDAAFAELKRKSESTYNGIIDYVGKLCNTVIIVDWKTGQSQKYAHMSQLELYAIWAFEHFPTAEKVVCSFFFIEQNAIQTITLDRTSIAMCRASFSADINRIEGCEDYQKRKTVECEKCPYFEICAPHKINLKRN